MGHLGQLESTRSEGGDGDGPITLTRTVKTAMKERGITGKGEEDEEENSGEREKEKEKPLKWDKYRKRKEKKIESWVLIFGLISDEMDCPICRKKALHTSNCKVTFPRSAPTPTPCYPFAALAMDYPAYDVVQTRRG
ncbi:hypothetical protein SDJN03_03406, partial [Cucurbita argyrosperma subsp. sororia]